MDRSEYMTVDADYWYNKGKEDERAKIVAWLRSPSGEAWSGWEDQAIEAGEHLK